MPRHVILGFGVQFSGTRYLPELVRRCAAVVRELAGETSARLGDSL